MHRDFDELKTTEQMEKQREICLSEFKKSRIENTPMNWHIWKRAYDRGIANAIQNHGVIGHVSIDEVRCDTCTKTLSDKEQFYQKCLNCDSEC